jgi:uncharacterized protein YkwD
MARSPLALQGAARWQGVGHNLRKLLPVLLTGALLALGASATAEAHAANSVATAPNSVATARAATVRTAAERHARKAHRGARPCSTISRVGHHSTSRAARRAELRKCRRAAQGTRAYRRRHHKPKAQHRSTARSAAGSTPATAPSAATTAQRDAATIARVLASTCQNTEVRPEADNVQTVDAATLCLVNQVRARNGELPLKPNAELEEAALEHSQEMVSQNYFAHVSPSGETPLERVKATGYIPNEQVGYTIGENIAWGTLQLSTPSTIVAAWVASPEHLANILDSSYTETGMGVEAQAPAAFSEGNAGAVYSQVFGVIVEG